MLEDHGKKKKKTTKNSISCLVSASNYVTLDMMFSTYKF